MKYQLKNKAQQGFTLIELMIVIAILAILMAIAIPAYQDFTIRTKVAEGVGLAAPAKLSIAEAGQSLGILAQNVTEAQSGYTFTAGTSDYVDTLQVSGPGVITITTTNTGATADPVLTLTANQTALEDPINWTCTTTAGLLKHVPAECR